MGPYDEGFRKEMLMKHWYNCLTNQGMDIDFSLRRSTLFRMIDQHMTADEKIPSTEPSISYHDLFYSMAQNLVPENVLRDWLTQGYDWDEMQNLTLLNTPLKRAVFCIDPANRVENFLKDLKTVNQEMVELDFSERFVFLFLNHKTFSEKRSKD